MQGVIYREGFYRHFGEYAMFIFIAVSETIGGRYPTRVGMKVNNARQPMLINAWLKAFAPSLSYRKAVWPLIPFLPIRYPT